MLKGGYQIIDFENKNHNFGVGVVHEGIYDKIEGTRKTCLLSGVVVNNFEFRDVFVSPSIVGGSYVFPIVGYTDGNINYFIITVEDTDVVTVSRVE